MAITAVIAAGYDAVAADAVTLRSNARTRSKTSSPVSSRPDGQLGVATYSKMDGWPDAAIRVGTWRTRPAPALRRCAGAGVQLFADRRWPGSVRPSDLAELIFQESES